MRISRFAAVVVLAVGVGLLASPGGAGAADPVPPLVTTLQAVLDGVGDVVDTLTSSLLDDAGADVTQASVEYAPGWVRMKVQLKNPINPLRDPRWSDANFVEWSFDTNGDANPDYTVEFSTEKGEVYGAIFDAANPDNPSLCAADSASFSPQDGYSLVIDPACIGNPKTIGYAVSVVLDTNPNDANAPVLSDRVPDQGMKLVAAPVQPGQGGAATPATPITPHVAPPAPVSTPTTTATAAPAPKPAASPAATAPKPPSSTATTAPKPTTSTVPARSAMPAAVATAAPSAPAAAPVAAPQPVPELPRTGTAGRQSALLGLGITLLGAGMLVMTGQKRKAPQPV